MSNDFQKALSLIREKSNNDKELGDYFERLCKVFFENDDVQKQYFSEVYTYSEWAKSRPEYSSFDIGIDLVAKLRDEDGYASIQCKCYSDENRITKEDLDSFISLYSKSNAPSFSGVNKTQFNDFAKLIGSDFNYFVIRDSYTVSQNINSYLTSRWVSSLLGRDDRKLDGQLGWRFVLLNRIDDQDFFCCFEKGKGIFILFDDEISTVISVEKVKSMLLKDS
jgi:hypothetical protein